MPMTAYRTALGKIVQWNPNLAQYILATKSNGQGLQVVHGSSSGTVSTYTITVAGTATPTR